MTRRAPAAAGDKNPGKKEATVGRTWRRLSYTPSIQTSIRLLCNYRDCMLPIECTVGVIYFLHFIPFYPIPFRTLIQNLNPMPQLLSYFSFSYVFSILIFLPCYRDRSIDHFYSYFCALLPRSLNRSLLLSYEIVDTRLSDSPIFTPPSHPFTILCNLSEVLQSSL